MLFEFLKLVWCIKSCCECLRFFAFKNFNICCSYTLRKLNSKFLTFWNIHQVKMFLILILIIFNWFNQSLSLNQFRHRILSINLNYRPRTLSTRSEGIMSLLDNILMISAQIHQNNILIIAMRHNLRISLQNLHLVKFTVPGVASFEFYARIRRENQVAIRVQILAQWVVQVDHICLV